MRVPPSSCEKRQLLDIGLNQNVGQIEIIIKRISIKPLSVPNPRILGTVGRATSASTSNTVRSISIAMLIARLTVQKLFPSPASALVTMIKFPFLIMPGPLLNALVSKGRLITRNCSAICVLPSSGVTMPY